MKKAPLRPQSRQHQASVRCFSRQTSSEEILKACSKCAELILVRKNVSRHSRGMPSWFKQPFTRYSPWICRNILEDTFRFTFSGSWTAIRGRSRARIEVLRDATVSRYRRIKSFPLTKLLRVVVRLAIIMWTSHPTWVRLSLRRKPPARGTLCTLTTSWMTTLFRLKRKYLYKTWYWI